MPRGGARPGSGPKRKYHSDEERRAARNRRNRIAQGLPPDRPLLVPCVWCGGDVEQPARGRPKVYCSEGCREDATRRRFYFICSCGRLRLSPFSSKTQSKCDHCRLVGELEHKARDRIRQAKRDKERWRVEKGDPAYRDRKRRERLARQPPKPASDPNPCSGWPKLRLSNCKWCDLAYWHSSAMQFCSEQCRIECNRSNITHSEWMSGKRRAPCCHICIDCGTAVDELNQKCDPCKQITRAAERRRRKARRRGVATESYTLLEIAERDGFLCGICGESVDMSLEGHFSDDWAPTRDHIIPVSRGGSDLKNNVQLAHRKCNWLKGDKMPDLQDKVA